MSRVLQYKCKCTFLFPPARRTLLLPTPTEQFVTSNMTNMTKLLQTAQQPSRSTANTPRHTSAVPLRSKRWRSTRRRWPITIRQRRTTRRTGKPAMALRGAPSCLPNVDASNSLPIPACRPHLSKVGCVLFLRHRPFFVSFPIVGRTTNCFPIDPRVAFLTFQKYFSFDSQSRMASYLYLEHWVYFLI